VIWSLFLKRVLTFPNNLPARVPEIEEEGWSFEALVDIGGCSRVWVITSEGSL
jgi:hypothetical protein